jgi:hypothetical protein
MAMATNSGEEVAVKAGMGGAQASEDMAAAVVAHRSQFSRSTANSL